MVIFECNSINFTSEFPPQLLRDASGHPGVRGGGSLPLFGVVHPLVETFLCSSEMKVKMTFNYEKPIKPGGKKIK